MPPKTARTYRDDAFIGGRWEVAGRTVVVENPAPEQQIGTSAMCNAAQVNAAVSAARGASAGWADTKPEDRADYIATVAAVLKQRRDELIDVTIAEVGVARASARAWHVDLAIELFESAALNARSFAFEEMVGSSLLHRKPVGVVACITPWNYPLYQLAAKVGPALAAGCTVVLKPAELAPLSSYVFAEAVETAELPAGVFNLVPGSGTEVGAELVAHPDIDFVSFTGSTSVGRSVAARAATNLKRSCLELGGKSSSLVCADAEFETAVRATVDSAMLNSGQTCSAWTRLLVPAKRYQEALAIASDHADRLTIGDPTSEQTDLGPLISAKQRAAVEVVVRAAVERGARVVNKRDDPAFRAGHYVTPTVLADLSPDDPASQDEIFGPVLVVTRTQTSARRSTLQTEPPTGSPARCGPGAKLTRSTSPDSCPQAKWTSTVPSSTLTPHSVDGRTPAAVANLDSSAWRNTPSLRRSKFSQEAATTLRK